MTRRLLAGAIAVVITAVGSALPACGSFESGSEPEADASGVSDSAVADEADAAVRDAADGAPSGKRVFVLPKGLLPTEVAQADAECSKFGRKAVSWTSQNGAPPSKRLNGEGPWVQPDNRVVFETRAGLSNAAMKSGINRDVDDRIVSGFVWTGVTADGNASSTDCRKWTNNAGSSAGTVGELGATDGAWTARSAPGCGTGRLPVICFDTD